MEATTENPIPANKPLPLPVGNSDWAHVAAHNWYADKTQLISGLLERDATVALFTRPHRFGKTFAMNMLQTFFEKTPESNARLFEGTKVWTDHSHRSEQGRYPVISINFKDTKGTDWNDTRMKLASAVRAEFKRHAAAFDDDKCCEDAKTLFKDIIDRRSVPPDLDTSLSVLASTLHAVHGERPVILIDEYDSPINWAATHGFTPKAYWTSTSSNDLVSDLLSRMTPKMRDSLADFFEKGESLVPCHGDLGPYGTVQNDRRRIWPLLVHTGYLKAMSGPDEDGWATLAFPNRELVRVFRDDILAPLDCAPDVGDDLQNLVEYLKKGDAED